MFDIIGIRNAVGINEVSILIILFAIFLQSRTGFTIHHSKDIHIFLLGTINR